ncbi:MAG: DNA-binding protein WhiA [Oscillospiraceae bacterium]|jgi:DNA-binding protein WhiA|nr:DNA-binding protein WhiA [Oscillospiraceae bacterium]
MSFSIEVKNQLCAVAIKNTESAVAECYGMLLFAKSFCSTKIAFSSTSEAACDRLIYLLNLLFPKIIIDKKSFVKSQTTLRKQFTVQVPLAADCAVVVEFFGHSDDDKNLRINRSNFESEENYSDFLRGVFLSVGSVTDPQKSYHLEFCVAYKKLCLDLARLLTEAEHLEMFMPGVMQRKGLYVCYVKGSETITDLLVLLGAQKAALQFMDEKALKQLRNHINRKTNSEVANIEKSAAAAAMQIKAIQKLQKTGLFNTLSPELKQAAQLRLQYPEMSLRDLGRQFSPEVSRSGVNHRLEKIRKIALEQGE